MTPPVMAPLAGTRGETTISLGLGQLDASADPAVVLVCLGLGSCVAIAAYDAVHRVAGMAHMVLPSSREARNAVPSPKFVDIAIPLLFEKMEKLGARRESLAIKLVGGAQVLASATRTDLFNVGGRNAESAQRVLAEMRLRVKASDTGGNRGRTARLYAGTGKLIVSKVGEPGLEL